MIDMVFRDIGIFFIIAAIFAYLLRLLKQPLIPGYILAGILVGPIMGIITDVETIRMLSEIGIAFLLFIVGLELDLKKLRDVGSIATIGAIVQMVILFGLGYILSVVLGFNPTVSIYLGLILAFSSTMVVIKLLSDKYELDTLHGRIIIGILLMQDIIAVVALTVLRDLTSFDFAPFVVSLAKGFALLIIAVLLGKFVFPGVFRYAAKHQELLFLTSLTVCFLFSILFAAADFSIAIGAFIAGITLANLPYNIEIISRVKSLRDFFSVLFFTAIGAELVLVNISTIILPLIIFTVFTVILLPILTIALVVLFGYKTRTAFITGIALAQISEFGLIIAQQGRGIIGEEVFSLVIFLALITMGLTAYFIKYDEQLYRAFGKYFKPLEKMGIVSKELAYVRQDRGHDYVLIGLDRIGYSIFRKLRALHKDVVVVDFNPDIVKKLLGEHVPCIYGDVGDVEIMEKLRFEHVKMLISTIPDHKDNTFLINKVKGENKDTIIIVTSYGIEEALDLYDIGADYVIVPHYLGGEHMSVLLEDISTDLDKLITTKLAHIRELRHRQIVHPNHR